MHTWRGGSGAAVFSDVRPEGFEPPTMSLEPTCSIQLSYGRMLVF